MKNILSAIIIFSVLLCSCAKVVGKKIISGGRYKSVEYIPGAINKKTVIYFTDGKTAILDGFQDINIHYGDSCIIYTNVWDDNSVYDPQKHIEVIKEEK